MKETMTKRERVERTMAFQETDRLPVHDLLRNDAMFAHVHGKALPSISKENEPQLRAIAGKAVDRCLDMTRSFIFGPVDETPGTDKFEFVWKASIHQKSSWIEKRPFDDEEGAIGFLKKYIPHLEEMKKNIEANPRAYRENHHRNFTEMQGLIGDTVHALVNHGTGVCNLRSLLGFELFTYVYYEDPGLLSEVFEAWTEKNIAECHAIADLALSPMVLTYGDIAAKNSLLHSPEFLRKEFYPRLERLQDAWHEHGFKCLFHSDGNIMEALDDLIEAGIDGLNPLEILSGLDIKEVHEKTANKVFLTGGIDMSQLLPFGTPEEVFEVCRQTVEDAGPGYFIGSSTEADNGCKLGNLIVMYETALGKGALSQGLVDTKGCCS